MSCVVLRLLVEEFLRQRCAEPVAVSYQFDATHEVTVETLVSLLQGRRVLCRGRRPCEYILERLFSLDAKGRRTVFVQLPLHVSSMKRHGPTWLLHTRRSSVRSRAVADV